MPNDTGRAVVRAAYGLVADEYAVVGHTPNLSRDEARELAQAVGVGDLTTTVDDALSFLDVPGWGLVCTRYTTERDARGRVALASDSVAADAVTFTALRADPFRCFPRRQDRPTTPGELAVPRFSASAPGAEAERLADARRALDEGAVLRPLLAALLAGERVLHIADEPLPTAVLQCLVLVLPPSLRRLMTFQTIAARAPRHVPRLTVAERRFADFASVEWTRELPRQSGSGDARADRVAEALLALPPAALHAAHALYEERAPAAEVAPADLGAEVAHVARYGAILDALGRRDAGAALAAMGTPRDDEDARCLTELLLAGVGAQALAAAIGGCAREGRVDGCAAAAVPLSQLVRRLARGDAGAAEVVRATLGTTDDVRWTADEAAGASLRATLAVGAAWLGDADRFLRLADLGAPWPDYATDRPTEPRARTAAGALGALVRAADGDPDRAAAALDALCVVAAPTASGRGAAAALGIAVARRAFARCEAAGAPDALERIADALDAFWAVVPPLARDEPLRAFLDVDGRTDVRVRAAVDAVRGLAGAGASAGELAGWIGAATLRTLLDDGDGARDARPLVAALDACPDGAPVELALGRLLAAAAPAGPPLSGSWPALLGRVGDAERGTLLLRALSRAAAGDVRLDALAATCAALAELGFVLDASGVDALASGLAPWAQTLGVDDGATRGGATRGAAARLGAALGLLGALADAPDAARLAARVLAAARPAVRDLVWMRRLAAAAIEVEATRDADAWSARREAVRAAGGELRPGERATLREFFGLGERGLGRLARLWRGGSPNGTSNGTPDETSPEGTR